MSSKSSKMREESYVTGSGEIDDFECALFKNRCLSDFFLLESEAHFNRVAQIDGITGKSQTFGKLCDEAKILAASLQDIGIEPKDCISICSENRMEYSAVVIATIFTGGVLSPLNPTYTPDEIVHMLNITRPKVIFCSLHTLKNVRLSLPRLNRSCKVVLLDETAFESVTSYRSLLENDLKLKQHKNKNTDAAVILASSGTTGLPKGVVLSYNNLKYFCNLTVSEFLNLKPNDVILGLLPLFHGYGYGLLVGCLLFGVRHVHNPKFEETLFLSTIEKYKVTILCLVPPLMLFLGHHPLVARYDLSSVRMIVCGAAPLAADIARSVSLRLPRADIRQGYGMTETAVAVSITPPFSKKIESVGKLASKVEGKVVDESGKIVARGQLGELCFRGPCVMLGYCGDSEATNAMIDSEGWLHSGDVGYVDDQDYFYIVDRIKELIKFKGFQVAPAELEAVLMGLDGVVDAAVVGKPDLVSGELPLAYVALKPSSSLTAEQVMAFVNNKVSPQKRLREIFDFELSEDEMLNLNGLDQGEIARVVDFSFFKGLAGGHPEFPF